MKNIFFPFFFPVCSALSAQTISNVKLAYSCPCKVTATYDPTGVISGRHTVYISKNNHIFAI